MGLLNQWSLWISVHKLSVIYCFKNSNKQGKIQEAKAARVTVLEFIATVGAKKTTEKLVLIGKDSSAETTL
jgi:hypothetical protein